MVAIPPPSQPTVDAIWAAREREHAEDPRSTYEGYGISASALGSECDRQLWYSLRWASAPERVNGRSLRIFERGNIEEDRVIADLRRAGVDVGREQERYALANGWLRGKIDAVGQGFLEAPKAEHVVEIKSSKAATYRAVMKHGLAKAKPEHWHQLHSGMAALGIERGAYVIANKDTEELYIERIHLDHEEAARQEARVLRLVDAHDAPGRVSDKPDSFACRFCQHKSACHERAMPRRTCRSCLFFAFGRDGNGHCARFDEPRSPDRQREGATCPAHLFLPALVPAEQVDADDAGRWIEYLLPDGSTWRDGADEISAAAEDGQARTTSAPNRATPVRQNFEEGVE